MASKLENPFSMRFVLPEQRALYLQMKEDDKLVSMPIVEQDELEALNYIICDSARSDYAITVTWWKQVKGNLGTTCTMWGVVKWIDQQGWRIKLVNARMFAGLVWMQKSVSELKRNVKWGCLKRETSGFQNSETLIYTGFCNSKGASKSRKIDF